MEKIKDVREIPKYCQMMVDGKSCYNAPEVVVSYETTFVKGILIICNEHLKSWQEELEKWEQDEKNRLCFSDCIWQKGSRCTSDQYPNCKEKIQNVATNTSKGSVCAK